MSQTLRRRLCAACQERRARFRHRGRVKADRDHVLCFECFRAETNRARARRLAAASLTQRRLPFPTATPVAALTPTQVAHRARMLAHLGGQQA